MQTPMLLALGVVASVPVDGHKGTGLKGAVSGSLSALVLATLQLLCWKGHFQ